MYDVKQKCLTYDRLELTFTFIDFSNMFALELITFSVNLFDF